MDKKMNHVENSGGSGIAATAVVTKKSPGSSARKRKKKKDKGGTIFFATMMALPIIQFIIFYVVVNFNSIVLAFQTYTISDKGYELVPTGFDNFLQIFHEWKTTPWLANLIPNSVRYFLLNVCVVMPLSLLFAYYIYKKMRFGGFYKVMLFLPSVICNMVIVLFYRDFVDWVIAPLFNVDTLWGGNGDGATIPLMILYVLLSFSGSILLFLNAMSSIPESTIEAAKIDGASEFRTFFSVVLPSIWGTIVSLLILAFAELAMGQANLYSIYGSSSPYSQQTLGYYIFNLMATNQGNDITMYPKASAYGLLATAIIAPITMIARKLLLKYGPSEE